MDGDLARIKAWADRLDTADADAGRRDITARRLLVHVIRDHVNVINTYIRTADDMRARNYRPEVVWAAAALADAYAFNHAPVFVRTASATSACARSMTGVTSSWTRPLDSQSARPGSCVSAHP